MAKSDWTYVVEEILPDGSHRQLRPVVARDAVNSVIPRRSGWWLTALLAWDALWH